MTANGYLQLALYLGVLLALAKPLGTYMAHVYEGRSVGLDRLGAPFEKLIYRLCGIPPAQEMRWMQYALAMLAFNVLGLLAVYALQRLQAYLPLNPQALGAVAPDSSFNTAVSFATNTDWQGYGGNGQEVHLTVIEYRLLTTLIRNTGKVLTHRQLLKEVWGPSHVEDSHYLRTYMAHLRQKLEADPAQPKYLITETGVGYRLID